MCDDAGGLFEMCEVQLRWHLGLGVMDNKLRTADQLEKEHEGGNRCEQKSRNEIGAINYRRLR